MSEGSEKRMSYSPLPHEQAYYDGLFAMADVRRAGAIAGPEAVQFFTRSKVPTEILKSVWTLADQPPTNALDKAKFYVAVRLIQLIQNGQKGQGPHLEAPPGVTLRPAMFEGVSGVALALPGSVAGAGGGPPVPPPPTPPRNMTPPHHPHQHQQQQQPPPPPHLSNALATQDPYLMTPTEQARYEDVFGQYATQDGFVYGKEAVELFGKSGLPKDQLAVIWTMVDQPVDNRLDKLEFAMAMHLIVCVSRKNLPLPTAMPMSLKQLKSQAPGSPPSQVSVPTPPQLGMPPTQPSMVPPQGIPSPMQQQPQQQQQQMGIHAPMGMPGSQQVTQPPQQGPPPQPIYRAPSPIPTPQGQHFATSAPPSPMPMSQQQIPPQMQSGMIPSPSRQHTSIPSPGGSMMTMQHLSMSSQMGPPIPTIPPTLQPPMLSQGMASQSTAFSIPEPPNLSTRASGQGVSDISDAFEGLHTGAAPNVTGYMAQNPPLMTATSFGGMSVQQEESARIPVPETVVESVSIPEPTPSMAVATPPVVPTRSMIPTPKASTTATFNTNDTMSELEKLKTIVQKLQAENISLKAQMGHMTEEEMEIQKHLAAAAAEIGTLSQNLSKSRAELLASKERLLEAAAELKAVEEKKTVITDLIAEANATRQAIDEAAEGIHQTVETMTHASAPPPSVIFEGDLFGFGSSGGAPPMASSIPPPQPGTSQPRSEPMSIPAPAGSREHLPSVGESLHSEPVKSYQSLDSVPSLPHYPPSSSNDLYPVTVQSESTEASMSGMGGHQRTDTAMSGFGDIMGSGPSFGYTAPPTEPVNSNLLHRPPPVPSATTASSNSSERVPTPGEIQELKAKLREAENVSRDADESRRQVQAQCDELRRLADEAEKKVRDNMKETEGKKKGFMGRSKKKDAKETEKLEQEAKRTKDAYLQSQSQLNDAKALAHDTKKEAERLRRETEDAEMKAASAASMESYRQAPSAPVSSNGFRPPPVPNKFPSQDGGMMNPNYPMGFGGEGFGVMGQPPSYSNPSVMGGGGLSIPTPSGNDPWSNPFSS